MSTEKALPDRWRIAALRHGENWTEYDKGTPPKDRYIASADEIIVQYSSRTGSKYYRTIHGATDRKQVGDVIRRQIRKVSPIRKK